MSAIALEHYRTTYKNNRRRSTVRSVPRRGRHHMKRKPDLLWVLVILFSLGMVTTGYTQSQWDHQPDLPVSVSRQP